MTEAAWLGQYALSMIREHFYLDYLRKTRLQRFVVGDLKMNPWMAGRGWSSSRLPGDKSTLRCAASVTGWGLRHRSILVGNAGLQGQGGGRKELLLQSGEVLWCEKDNRRYLTRSVRRS